VDNVFTFSLNGERQFEYKPITTSYSLGRNKWVDFGINNDLPDQTLALRSVSNSQMLFFKALLLSGGGWAIDEKNKKLQRYIEDYDQNQVLQDISKNFVRNDGYSLQLLPNLKGDIIIRHLDFSKVRVSEELADDEQTSKFCYVSKNWKDYRRPAFKPVEYPAFIFNETTIDDILQSETPHICYNYIKAEGQSYYPLPMYKDAIPYIMMEDSLSTYLLSSVDNGFVASAIIHFPDTMNEEERKELIRNLKQYLQGPKNGCQFVALFGPNAPTITVVPSNNNVDIYDNLKNTAQSFILAAHALNSPSLASLPGGGSIFSNEMSTAYRYFERTVIKYYQEPLIKCFTRLWREMGLLGKDEKIGIKSLNALEFIFDSALMEKLYWINELRAKAGDAPLPEGDVTPASVSAKQNNSINITPPSETKPSGLNPLAGDTTTGEPKSIE
jgi:hypothetical protein